MAKLTKQELISRLALHERLGSNAAASDVLDELLTIITMEVVNGNEVYLGQPFGGFKAATQAARSGTNALTGKPFSSPAKQVIKFAPSAALKATVAGV